MKISKITENKKSRESHTKFLHRVARNRGSKIAYAKFSKNVTELCKNNPYMGEFSAGIWILMNDETLS